ncbi:MAG: response regulator [bacterium]
MSTKTILIIEDSIPTIATYMQIIEAVGLDVISLVAPTYEKAKRIMEAEQVDLIILDLILPDVVGTDVLEELRRAFPIVPILLVTGHPEQIDRQKAQQLGASDLFIKPFRLEAFRNALDNSLQASPCGGPCPL